MKINVVQFVKSWDYFLCCWHLLRKALTMSKSQCVLCFIFFHNRKVSVLFPSVVVTRIWYYQCFRIYIGMVDTFLIDFCVG